MFWLVLLMLVILALAVGIIGVVAIPARREGRGLFTQRGRRVIAASQSRAANVRVPGDPKTALVQRMPRRKAKGDSPK